MVKRTKGKISEERALDRLASNSLRWIKIVALALGFTVTYLELRDAPLDAFTRSFDNSSLMKIGMVAYFFGWLWGITNDTEIQRQGYCRDPKLGIIGKNEIAGIIVFLIVFSSLFFINDYLIIFQAALLTFVVVNIWTWRVIFERTKPIIDASYAKFTLEPDTRDNCSLLKLLTVVQYMNGPWQRRRFISLVVIAALQLGSALVVQQEILAPYVTDLKFNGVPASLLIGYLPGVFFILWVLVSEIWIGIYRIKVLSDLSMIDYFEDHFSISKRRDAPMPKPHLAALMDFSPTPNQSYVGHGPLDWFIDRA